MANLFCRRKNVLNYPVPENKSGPQMVELLHKRLEQLGAIRSGTFTVDCETYQGQLPLQQRMVHLFHNSEEPASCMAVMDNGLCLVADTLFDFFMQKLSDYYSPRRGSKLESRGQRFELGDFIVKVGSVVLGPSTAFKGILVEVEYCPCMVPNDCWNLMKEFMQGFMGQAADTPSNYMKNKMDVPYSPVDTILQYLEYFTNFRKMVVQTR